MCDIIEPYKQAQRGIGMKRYCGNCGELINSKAQMCKHCGNVVVTDDNDPRFSEKYVQIIQYKRSLTVPLVLAIIGLACSAGIGIFFTFSARKRADRVFVPKSDNLTPDERMLYDGARKKHNTIKILTAIAMWIFLIQLVLILFLIAWNVFVPCIFEFQKAILMTKFGTV